MRVLYWQRIWVVMNLLALIIVLVLEKTSTTFWRGQLTANLVGLISLVQRYFGSGQRKHGIMAWFTLILGGVGVATVLFWLLNSVHPVLGWLFNLLVLFCALHFRHSVELYQDIQLALSNNDLAQAQQLLHNWRPLPSSQLSYPQVIRLSIETLVVMLHRSVLAPIVWLVLTSLLGLGGAAGVVLYSLSKHIYQQWDHTNRAFKIIDSPIEPITQVLDSELQQINQRSFGRFSELMFYGIDWLPCRLSMLLFAIVGNFESALFNCYDSKSEWPERSSGLLLACAAGALEISLGQALTYPNRMMPRPELGTGEAPNLPTMGDALTLLWRSSLLLLALLLLLSVFDVLT